MDTDEFLFRPIGTLSSPHKDAAKTPIQPVFARGIEGTVTLQPEYSDGLMDLEGFSYIYLLYVFHKARQTKLRVQPFLEDKERGVFATRAPCRPVKLGFSLVKLVRIEANVLHIEDVDILDGTPILDIKPYIKRFDSRENVRSGWQDEIPQETAEVRGRRGLPPSTGSEGKPEGSPPPE